MSRVAYLRIGDEPVLACVVPSEVLLGEGDACVAEVGRLLEYGEVVRLETVAGEDAAVNRLPAIVRAATPEDRTRAEENARLGRAARATCEEAARRLRLDIRLARVGYSFERVVLRVLFVAQERVEVRDLIRTIAEQLRVRVDLRQIGVRDEAGILGGLGTCGRVLCCCAWMRRFESVNVRMAKAQGLPLNPAVISGMCGRLKCCLRYEFEQYRRLAQALPPEGAVVECPGGTGTVVERNVLEQIVWVRMPDDRVQACAAADVKRTARARPGAPEPGGESHEEEGHGPEWAELESAGET